MEQVNLATVIDQVCQEKRISKDVLIETVEQAVLRAAEKVFPDRLMEAEFDTETGQIKLGVVLYVVEEVQLPLKELSMDQARRSGLEAELGDELVFPIYYAEA
ncbi:MAG: NusA N-terminal domain-containing protein, partial [Nannocystaceae bacterium]